MNSSLLLVQFEYLLNGNSNEKELALNVTLTLKTLVQMK